MIKKCQKSHVFPKILNSLFSLKSHKIQFFMTRNNKTSLWHQKKGIWYLFEPRLWKEETLGKGEYQDLRKKNKYANVLRVCSWRFVCVFKVIICGIFNTRPLDAFFTVYRWGWLAPQFDISYFACYKNSPIYWSTILDKKYTQYFHMLCISYNISHCKFYEAGYELIDCIDTSPP